MRRYLDFFDVALPGPKPYFHSNTNSLCRWDTVYFTDDSFDNIISWQWEFPGGIPSSSTEKNPSVYYIDAGNYDVKLTVSDGIHSRSIHKRNFITVNVCAGIDETVIPPALTVYPNPSGSLIHIKSNRTLTHGSKLFFYDLMGRKVLEKNIQKEFTGENIIVDISSLPKGLYIVNLISGTTNEAIKLVVE
jgi:PKD repeat protein